MTKVYQIVSSVIPSLTKDDTVVIVFVMVRQACPERNRRTRHDMAKLARSEAIARELGVQEGTRGGTLEG